MMLLRRNKKFIQGGELITCWDGIWDIGQPSVCPSSMSRRFQTKHNDAEILFFDPVVFVPEQGFA